MATPPKFAESALFWGAMYSGGRDREDGGGSPAKRSHIDKGEGLMLKGAGACRTGISGCVCTTRFR